MLNKIIENKIEEIGISKKILPLHGFKNKLEKSRRDFKKAISKGKLNLIAEIKRRSPSKNIPKMHNKNFSIKKIVDCYNKYADTISVLTDKKFFGGSLDDMETVSRLTSLPVLRKDFIIDEYQIYESRLYGADAVLLIASVLSIEELNYFIDVAERYSMDCLVEVSNEEELGKVLRSNACIIGINNRNLYTLEVDTETTLRLIGRIPEGKIIVSESGILSKSYVKRLPKKVNAILVGTLFMNSVRLEEKILSLMK